MAMSDLSPTEQRVALGLLALGQNIGPVLATFPMQVRVQMVQILHRVQPFPEDLYVALIQHPQTVLLQIYGTEDPNIAQGYGHGPGPGGAGEGYLSPEQTSEALRREYQERYINKGVPPGHEAAFAQPTPADSLIQEAEEIVRQAAGGPQITHQTDASNVHEALAGFPPPVSGNPEGLTEQQEKLLTFGAMAAMGVNPFELAVGGTGGTDEERIAKIYAIVRMAREMGLDVSGLLEKLGLPPEPPENGGHTPGCPNGH